MLEWAYLNEGPGSDGSWFFIFILILKPIFCSLTFNIKLYPSNSWRVCIFSHFQTQHKIFFLNKETYYFTREILLLSLGNDDLHYKCLEPGILYLPLLEINQTIFRPLPPL